MSEFRKYLTPEYGKFLSSMDSLVTKIKEELLRASAKFDKFNSAHEGYAVLLEEVDELWEEVKKKQGKRDVEKMKDECIQISAMAMRFYLEICEDQKGLK